MLVTLLIFVFEISLESHVFNFAWRVQYRNMYVSFKKFHFSEVLIINNSKSRCNNVLDFA